MNLQSLITNNTLRRQIQRHLGKDTPLPEDLLRLLESIQSTYEHYEKDRELLERSMELSSNELYAANRTLKKEAAEREQAISKLEDSLSTLGLIPDSDSKTSSLTHIAEAVYNQVEQRIVIENELHETMQKLLKAKEEAEQSNRAKSAFLSAMTHELRTPLNAIIGFAQVLSHDQLIPKQAKKNIQIMHSSGLHLLGVINDILDITKIESGGMELHNEATNLPTSLTDITAMFQQRCVEKGLYFSVAFCKNLPSVVYIDVLRLKQILINLLGNAVKFTKTGGVRFEVQCKLDQASNRATLKFVIQDTGRGIPQEQLHDILEPFKQVRGTYSEGTGLGLSITSSILQIMGSSLSIDSQEGVGSTFSFEIEIQTEPNIHIKEKQQTGLAFQRVTKPCTALVVDDIETNRQMITSMLGSIGITCFEAANGAEALHLLKNVHPDILFIDIQMPVMDGIEFTSILRNESTSTTPFCVALTAAEIHEIQSQYPTLFDAFISKPVAEPQLRFILENICKLEFVEMPTIQQDSTFSLAKRVRAFVTALPMQQQQTITELLATQNTAELEQFIHLLGDIPHEFHATIQELLQSIHDFDVAAIASLSDEFCNY